MAEPDATYHTTRLAPSAVRREVWRHVAGHLSPYIPPDGAVLDLAAGYGDFTAAVQARRRVAVDLFTELPLHVPDGVEAVVGDATDLSVFADESFDVVFASNFLEHLEWEAIDRCVAGAHRVLKPGGRLILVQPNFRLQPGAYFDDYTHRTIFTDRSLCDYLMVQGFAIERVEPRFLPLSLRSRLSWGHRLVPLYLRLPYRPMAGQMLVVARRPAGNGGAHVAG
jgi:SAM-dependent methyltransferase